MSKKQSIHTIAKEVGLSATTVSLIINGVGKENRISDAAIKRVEDYLEKIDYSPNVLAKALRTGKTNVIGMLVEDISDPFFSSIARGVEVGLEQAGYRIFFMSTKNKLENAKFRLDVLKSYNVDGFIMAPTPGLEKEIQKLTKAGKPVVLFDRYSPELQTCNIVVDNRRGAMTGAMELMNSGYQNIGLVTLVSKQVQMEDRKLGYLDALGTIHTDKRILEVPYNQTTEQNTLAIREFLLNNKTLDGMLFGTNYLAIAGLQAFKDLKLTVGKDIGVVGFDDNTNFALFTPSITAIAQPVEHIARCIVKEMVNALAKDPNWLPTTTILNTTLVKRESSTKL